MSYVYRSTRPGGRARNNSRGRSSGNRNNRGPKAQYIDPRRFIKSAKSSEESVYTAQNSFVDFDLHELLHSNLSEKGYATPSPIQDKAIPAGLQGQDVIGIASTGTGKTAAFALPMLQKLITDNGSAALIVAPTRELAQQIEEECRALGKNSGLTGALLIGGTSMGPQLRDLRNNPRVIIGTPGRIKDHLNRGSLNLSKVNMIVLDEVDRMLDMGFVNDVTEILSATRPERQSFFFSATMDGRVQQLLENFTTDPLTIKLQASTVSENIHQDVVHFSGTSDKLDKLHDLLIQGSVSKVVIFDETKRSVERLSKELVTRGFNADALHGGKSQGQRQRALKRFKDNDVDVLVATDVAARGLDVSDISHVVNYSIPRQYDDYIHRIGRTGRAGQIGYAYTFINQ